MHHKKLLDALASRLSSALPFAREVSGELRTKIEQQLTRGLGELDLTTRSEFDAQTQSLRRADSRIEELGNTIEELEKRLAQFEETSSK